MMNRMLVIDWPLPREHPPQKKWWRMTTARDEGDLNPEITNGGAIRMQIGEGSKSHHPPWNSMAEKIKRALR